MFSKNYNDMGKHSWHKMVSEKGKYNTTYSIILILYKKYICIDTYNIKVVYIYVWIYTYKPKIKTKYTKC